MTTHHSTAIEAVGDGDATSNATPMDTPVTPTTTAVGVTRKRSTASSDSAVFKLLPKIAGALQWQQRTEAAQWLQQAADLIAERYPAVAKSIHKQLPRTLEPQRLVTCPDDLLARRPPRHGFDAVVVSDHTAQECRRVLDEHNRCAELATFKLEPRHKILISGPPGNGKTMLAEAFAFELDVPFLVVKPSGIIASYLGETGRNLNKLLDYASLGPCVLFLDEFDGIAKQRGGEDDVGEIHRVTNQLLLCMDQMPTHVTFICATNLDEKVDKAVLRRFDFHLELPAPNEALRLELARRELHPDLTPGHDLMHMAPRVAQDARDNLHAVSELCRRLRRQLALYGNVELTA